MTKGKGQTANEIQSAQAGKVCAVPAKRHSLPFHLFSIRRLLIERHARRRTEERTGLKLTPVVIKRITKKIGRARNYAFNRTKDAWLESGSAYDRGLWNVRLGHVWYRLVIDWKQKLIVTVLPNKGEQSDGQEKEQSSTGRIG